MLKSTLNQQKALILTAELGLLMDFEHAEVSSHAAESEHTFNVVRRQMRNSGLR
jgi:hypothetical protein